LIVISVLIIVSNLAINSFKSTNKIWFTISGTYLLNFDFDMGSYFLSFNIDYCRDYSLHCIELTVQLNKKIITWRFYICWVTIISIVHLLHFIILSWYDFIGCSTSQTSKIIILLTL
jgi:hypothetical protein